MTVKILHHVALQGSQTVATCCQLLNRINCAADYRECSVAPVSQSLTSPPPLRICLQDEVTDAASAQQRHQRIGQDANLSSLDVDLH
eukprot:CAMPEP_0181188688 /NCGR_PEP_ID=MMETSP1096-20121128/11256_1 /TAXON_ID=156174 ORGANISM="Chrysochromulina ericina, Strain CCMP281" /NCGR_SAMPLE_ID=MMETSP1096 /ASSEMBLY_ACC=CAM_ASM_000453 /LENGTH=86 /DNA_ID=CAMNT_0023277779 /DNA_START=130 /DNA_END=391 /DNA_ORIENTATION=-